MHEKAKKRKADIRESRKPRWSRREEGGKFCLIMVPEGHLVGEMNEGEKLNTCTHGRG